MKTNPNNRYFSLKKCLFLIIIIIEIIIVIGLIFIYDCYSGYLFYTPPESFRELNKFDKPQHPVGECIIKSTNPNLNVELKPYCEILSDGALVKTKPYKVTINSVGFRGREFTLKKPNQSIRIAMIGDSFTFGVGVGDEYVWSKILENKLNFLNNGINYEVLNFGVPGYNLREYLEVISKVIKYEPDIIIIGYVGNDLIDNKEKEEFLRIRLANVSDNEEKTLIELETEKEMDHKIRGNTSLVKEIIEFYFNKIINISQNTTVIIANFYGGDNSLLKEITKNLKNWYVLNMIELLIQEMIRNGYCSKDLIVHQLDAHPNELAHHLFAEITYSFLRKRGFI